MPQVFGEDLISLIAQAATWSENSDIYSPSELFHNYLDEQGFSRERPLTGEQQALAGKRTTWTHDLGNKTIGGKPPRTDSNGQLLNGDGHHELVIHFDDSVGEGQKSAGGKNRYELGYHHIDRNGKLHSQIFHAGNSLDRLISEHQRLQGMMGRMR